MLLYILTLLINNTLFLSKLRSASALAQLYSTSTMEHHHFDQCIMIINSQVYNGQGDYKLLFYSSYSAYKQDGTKMRR